MRILILGGDGMLGHQLLQSYRDRHEVKVTLRRRLADYAHYGLFCTENTISNIDVRNDKVLSDALELYSPEVVINATGIVKQADEANSYIPSIEINALLPHCLSVHCRELGAKLVHFSTDCVFSGRKGSYDESDTPDPEDLYGRTKVLGELQERHCLTLRTSIIGLELDRKKSLIEWFLAQRGSIPGFRKAIYTGLITTELARLIEGVLLEHPNLSGVYHVASNPIDKFKLLRELSAKLHRTDITIEADDSFVCDRSLNSERFSRETGYAPPTWDEMLEELAGLIKLRERDEDWRDARK